MELFELPPPVVVPDESRTQRTTRTKRELLERGINPGSGLPITHLEETCGSCAHLVERGYGRKRFFKCGKGSLSSSETSDIRKKWPGCKLWEEKKDG